MDYFSEYKNYFGYFFITFPLICIAKIFLDKYQSNKSNKYFENKIKEKDQEINDIN